MGGSGMNNKKTSNVREVYYYPEKNCLVYLKEKATPQYWDKAWKIEKKSLKERLKIKGECKVLKFTKRYLPKGSKIIEAGCGKGGFVYELDKNNYDVIGVDYAEETIKNNRIRYPNLKFEIMDVRDLKYKDNYFDGYWSLGVIEHFYEGYNKIINEMDRVLKPGGYAFISFPHMSKLRRKKAKNNKYNIWKEDMATDKFFQFALDETEVIRHLQKKGYKLIEKVKGAGEKGFLDEYESEYKILKKLNRSGSILAKIIRFIMSKTLNFYTSHSILLIFKKKQK